MAPSPSTDDAVEERTSRCPAGMAAVADFCIDRWEAYVVELDFDGAEHPHSPYEIVDGLTVRAKTAPGVVPQGYISQVQAARACENAGKRLCTEDAFRPRAGGRTPTTFTRTAAGRESRATATRARAAWCPRSTAPTRRTGRTPTSTTRASTRSNGGLAPTGSYPRCKSPEGIYDCVGNLHEWSADPPDANGHGRFRGGFYGDAEINGHGCLYVTRAHEPTYHDYSTGFRCCADPAR